MNELLIEQYYFLIEKVAYSIRSKMPMVDMSDLLSSGGEGLLKAASTYKSELGVPFEPYARLKIYGAMMDEIRKMDWVPRYQRDAQKRISAYQEQQDYFVQQKVSLDVLVKDTIADPQPSIEASIESKEQTEELTKAIMQLPKRQLEVISLYYFEEFKMHEIAKILNISEAHVSRMHATAIQSLRSLLHLKKRKKRGSE